MATLCYGCGLTTDDQGRLILRQPISAVLDQVSYVAAGVDIDANPDTDVLECQTISYTNNSSCAEYVVPQFSWSMDLEGVRACGNPRVDFHVTPPNQNFQQVFSSQRPVKFLGSPRGSGTIVKPDEEIWAWLTKLEVGESFTQEYCWSFHNFLEDCTDCEDCDADPDCPDPCADFEENTQPRLTAFSFQSILLRVP